MVETWMPRPLRGQKMTNQHSGTISRTEAIALIMKALKIGESDAKTFLDKNFGPGSRIPVPELTDLLKLTLNHRDLKRRIRSRMQEIKKAGPDKQFRPEYTPTVEPGPTNDGPSLG